jgi:hypothetical protein
VVFESNTIHARGFIFDSIDGLAHILAHIVNDPEREILIATFNSQSLAQIHTKSGMLSTLPGALSWQIACLLARKDMRRFTYFSDSVEIPTSS